jgi:gluconolactonase
MQPLDINRISPRANSLVALDAALERVATDFRFVEGPLWDPRDGSLLFSDIPANRIYRLHVDGTTTVHREPSFNSNGLTWDLGGRLLACEHLGRRVSVELPDGCLAPVADSYGGKKLNSPNDLVLRSDGLLYFTDPPYGILNPEQGAIAPQEQPVNGVYLVRPGETEPILLIEDFDRPNGLAFSPDERHLYVIDTSRLRIHRFDGQADGTLQGGEIFVQLDQEAGVGRPDGMKVDEAGNIYTTGPGGLWIIAPDGEILAQIRFPERTANCAWGDADRRGLYICATTSIYRLRTGMGGSAAVW